MALLTSGSSSTFTGSSTSASVAVTAGNGNRKLIVGFAMEATVTVTALTFNGQDLVALGLEIPLTGITTDAVSQCVMFEQFEGGLPSSGSHTLSATFSGSATGGGRMFYWLVDGVRQDQLAEGGSGQVGNGGSSTSTFQTDETFVAGDDARAIFGVAYRNDNATSLLLTTPSGATNVADVTVTGGGRVSGSHKVGSIGTGTVRPTWTTQASGQNRRTGAACCLNPVSGATRSISAAAFSAGSASSSATASRGRSASASFAAGAATFAATVARVRAATAAFVAGSASSSATALRVRNLSAGFTSGDASSSASAQVSGNRTLTAAFQAGAAALAATVTRARTALAAFVAGSSSASASAVVTGNKSVSAAAFQAGAATFSATLDQSSPPVFPGTGTQRLVTAQGRQRILSTPDRQRLVTASGKQRLTSWNE